MVKEVKNNIFIGCSKHVVQESLVCARQVNPVLLFVRKSIKVEEIFGYRSSVVCNFRFQCSAQTREFVNLRKPRIALCKLGIPALPCNSKLLDILRATCCQQALARVVEHHLAISTYTAFTQARDRGSARVGAHQLVYKITV